MSSFLLTFLIFLIFEHLSLSEDTTPLEFDGRWITRPPADKEFPYAVFIKMSKATDETCSGTLIAMDWVLTAARCMFDIKTQKVVETNTSLTVYAGLDKRLNDTKHVQVRKSKEIRFHYLPGKDRFFTLALIHLDGNFTDNKAGKVVNALSLELDYELRTVVDHACRSGSYGRIEWDKERPPALKKTLSLIQPCNCSESLRQVFSNVPTEQWMCGEYTYDMGICKGDFGAALKCGKSFIGVAVDIATFRPGTCEVAHKVSRECSKVSTISIYTDVCYHLQWIHSLVSDVPVNKTPCGIPDSAFSVYVNNRLVVQILVLLYGLIYLLK